MIKDKNWLIIGQISSSYRLSGTFKLLSFAEPVESIFKLLSWYIFPNPKQIALLNSLNSSLFNCDPTKEGLYALDLEDGKIIGKNLIAKIKAIDNPEQAKILTLSNIYIKRETLPKLDQGYYWCDLIGLEVINLQGKSFGKVKRVFETNSSPIIEVYDINHKKTLIPFVPTYINKVDLENNQILVDWFEDY